MDILFVAFLFVAAAWRVWSGMSRAEDRAGRRQYDIQRQAPAAMCIPGRDGLYTGYQPCRDQDVVGVQIEAAQARQMQYLLAREVEVNERVTALARGEQGMTGDWGGARREALPEPGVVIGDWVELPVDAEWVKRG